MIFLCLSTAYGAPMNDISYKTQKSQKLKDLKVELKIIIPCEPEREECFKSFLLTTKVAKVKMMLKRHLKINPSVNLKLSYYSHKVNLSQVFLLVAVKEIFFVLVQYPPFSFLLLFIYKYNVDKSWLRYRHVLL